MYHPGFSSTFRRITGGVIVSLYPMPIIDRMTRFLPAIARSSASSSNSPRGSPSFSGSASRMAAGTVASTRSSSESCPTASIIARMSAAPGPTWRRTNVSDGANVGGWSAVLWVRPGDGINST